MIFRRFGAGLALAATLSMAAAPALADNYDAKDGNGVHQSFAAKLVGGVLHPLHLLEGLFGSTPTPVNMTNSGALDVTCVSGCSTTGNTLGSQGTITAADSATTSTAGQSAVNAVTGSPTANSFVTYAMGGAAAGGTLTISGTFVAASQIEASYDNGAHYTAASALLRGTNILTSAITGPGAFSVDLSGVTHLRVRATSYTSGTETVNFTYSPAPGLTKLLNGVKLVDSGGGDATDPANHAVKTTLVTAPPANPFLVTGNTTLAVTTASARVVLPSTDTTAVLSNTGTAPADCVFGSGAAVATTANSTIFPGVARTFSTGGALDVACITPSGSTTITVETGTGTPAFGLSTDFSQATSVQGPAAAGATPTGNPLRDGCLAKTALPTAVSDAQTVDQLCDKYGRRVSPSVLRENKGIQETDISGTGETTVITADASNKLELYCLILANTSTTNAATATVKDATAGTTRGKFQIPAGETRGFCGPADSGWPQASVNNNWTVTLAGTSPTVSATAVFLKSGS